jgi:hypothetical protein
MRRGIEHITVGPKSSHLNPCERANQSLNDNTKTHLYRSGFSKSFWWYAFLNGVYMWRIELVANCEVSIFTR